MKYSVEVRGVALCVLAFLLFIINLWPGSTHVPATSPVSEDLYDPILVKQLRSVDDLMAHTDSVARSKNIGLQSVAYWNEMAQVLRYRFYHGYAYYTPADNWIAYLSGTLVWDHLHAIVVPDDILKHPMAACSQQSIVLMACMKRRGVPHRAVKFAHHYAVEGRLEDRWVYFDTNMEPVLWAGERQSFTTYRERGRFEQMYAHRLDPIRSSFVLQFRSYGDESAAPAPNATIFHKVTGGVSRLLWVLPLVCFVYINHRRSVEREE